jgi:hypothetical protein
MESSPNPLIFIMPRLPSLALVLLLCAVQALGHNAVGADFAIPASNATVDVKMLDALSAVAGGFRFWAPNPDVPTSAQAPLAGYSFLIEHPHNHRRILFDLGIRKDSQNLAPAIIKEFSGPDGKLAFTVKQDVPDQLVAGNVTLASIDTVIWRCAGLDTLPRDVMLKACAVTPTLTTLATCRSYLTQPTYLWEPARLPMHCPATPQTRTR